MRISNRGASLIETIVTVAILGVAAMGMAQLVSNFADLRRYVEVSMETKQFISDIDETLVNSNLCQAALEGQFFNIDPNASPEGAVTLKVGSVTYDAANPPEQRYLFNDLKTRVRVRSMTLKNSATPPIDVRAYLSTAVPPVVVDATRHYATLTVTFEDDNPNSPRSLRPRTFDLAILTLRAPAASTIVKCSTDISFEDTCLEMGGNLNLATVPPTCDLAPVMEGCIPGGSYFLRNGSCSGAGNPHFGGACNCPTGYAHREMLDYDAIGGKAKGSDMIKLISCYKCPSP